MSSTSPNARRIGGASEALGAWDDRPAALQAVDDSTADSAADATTEAVDTFILEVSAGRPKGVGDASGAERRIDRPAANSGRAPAPVAAQTDFAAGDGEEWLIAAPAVDERPRGVRPAARRAHVSRRRTLPACSASMAVHAGLFALVGLLTIAQKPALEQLDLTFASDVNDDAEFSDAAVETPVDPSDAVEQIVDELPAGASIPGDEPATGDGGLAASGPLSPDALIAGKQGEIASGVGIGSFGQMGAMFGEGGTRPGGFDGGLGAPPLAKFFGATIEGHRIVFVLDNSGSMQDGRLETVITELERCVDSLAKDQQFYVIFYSDTVYPLFYPDPATQYVSPTPRNKQMLAAWLDTVELCLGDAVVEALSAAAAIEPDTVFLLSDGRVQGTKKMAFLLDARTRNFPIHTIGVGLGSSATASRRNLQDVATANGGELREAEVPEDMRQLARTRPRPYHADTPGAVWGRQVKSKGWGR